jgi:cadmium resistance protein CadD (predicted permease)
MLFYSQTNITFHRWHVVAGQYLGFTALVLISLLEFLGGLIVAREWIGLLGFLPIIIGVRHWLNRNKIEEENTAAPNISKSGVFSAVVGVAAVTFANGSDNIGIYTPLFASSNLTRLIIFLVVFYLLLGVWCVVSYFLTRLRSSSKF